MWYRKTVKTVIIIGNHSIHQQNRSLGNSQLAVSVYPALTDTFRMETMAQKDQLCGALCTSFLEQVCMTGEVARLSLVTVRHFQ